MTRRIPPTTLLLACAVAVLAAANWWALNMEFDTSPLAGRAQAPVLADAPAAELLPEAPQPPPDAGRESQSRPLFRANRRPAEESAPEAAGAVEAGSKPEGIELAGIMREPGRTSRALIRSSAAPLGDWVEIGHSIAGWRLAEIDEDGVVFEANGSKWRAALFSSQSQ